MAHAFKIANLTASAGADGQTARLNGGSLLIYDGSQPADADTAVSTQNLLATLTLPNPAFGAAASGVATANAISSVAAGAAGTAAWFRALTSGAAKVCDGTVGVGSSYDCNINAVAIAIGATVAVTSWTITQGKGQA